jgi:hypothetical protein
MAADRYGYLSNCVFIDEAAFHVNMKRTVAWSKVGTRTEVVLSKTREKSTTILGAICAIIGVINVKIKRLRALLQNKKRKSRTCAVACKNPGRVGAVTG